MRIGRTACQPSRVNIGSRLAWTVASKRSTPAFSASAQAARTKAVPAPLARRSAAAHRQPPARPPAHVRVRGRRAEPHPAQHLARPVAGDQHPVPRVLVPPVGVVPGEQALLGDEHLPAQRPVGVQGGAITGFLDVQRGGPAPGGPRAGALPSSTSPRLPAARGAKSMNPAAGPGRRTRPPR